MSRHLSQNFSFTWEIANFSHCYQENCEKIVSPSFETECIGPSLWYLEIYPKGIDEESVDFISCYLGRGEASFFDAIITVTVDYTLQIIGGNGGVLKTFQAKGVEFDEGDLDGSDKFVKFSKVINKLRERNEYTLTIRCIISHGAEKKMATAYVAHSEINVDRCKFEWNINYDVNVCDLPDQEIIFYLGELKLKIILGVEDNNLVIDIILMECGKAVPCLLTCQISFLGVPAVAFKETHLFRWKDETWELPILIESDQLRNFKNSHMTDKILPMLFDFSGSNGVVSQATPSYIYDKDSLSFFQSDFWELFVSKKHADVIFQVDNQELKLHKTVLIARSPVFSRMFDQDVTENRASVVVIADVDVDTMKSFLEYLYTGTKENINYDKTIKLFTVAGKYQVQSPMDECYSFLLPVLSRKNVCELVYVADKYHHASLKTAAMDYIASHAKEILSSPEWVGWSKKNLKLTSDILVHINSNCDITRRICNNNISNYVDLSIFRCIIS